VDHGTVGEREDREPGHEPAASRDQRQREAAREHEHWRQMD
jgi:hypothetical protein